MPLYEYQCEMGHIVEILRKIGERDINLPNCEECQFMYANELNPIIHSEMHPIFSLIAKIGTPDDSKSNFVYFQNAKTGEVDFTSTPNIYHKPGFEKKEARNTFERQTIEKKLRSQDDLRLAVQHEKQDFQRHHATSQRHAEIRNYIKQGVIVDKSEGESKTIHLDEQTKDFMTLAMERTNKIAPKRRSSELRLAVNHDDKSNRGTNQ